AEPTTSVTFQALQLQGQGSLASRASRRLKTEELLVTSLGPNRLRLELDRIPLWRGDHVAIGQVVEDFAQYLYLPRVSSPQVVVEAIKAGLGLITWEHDSFAYAESFDPDLCRYRGIQFGTYVAGIDLDNGLLVKPKVALAQVDGETTTQDPDPLPGDGGHGGTGVPGPGPGLVGPPVVPPPVKRAPTRFYGTVRLDQDRVGRDASRIAEELIAHLNGLVGAEVSVTLEVSARVPNGVREQVVRIVTENATTMKFSQHAFEEE